MSKYPFRPSTDVHFCPGAVGGAEWNSPAYDPVTNLIIIGQVEWCDDGDVAEQGQASVGPDRSTMDGREVHQSVQHVRQSYAHRRLWAGWVYAVDADTGVWKWRLKSNYPIVSGVTPTAGGVVFFGDMGGNFYALDSSNGQKLWGQNLGGAIGGGVITYTANGAQKVAVAVGVVMAAWPTKIVKAKVVVLGLEGGGTTSQ